MGNICSKKLTIRDHAGVDHAIVPEPTNPQTAGASETDVRSVRSHFFDSSTDDERYVTRASSAIEQKNIEEDRNNFPRKLVIVRHGERMDSVFSDWINSTFDFRGNYKRVDANMPITIPSRYFRRDWKYDCPLTGIGHKQAEMVGKGLHNQDISFKHIYCSPALRCVQSSDELLKGLSLKSLLKLKIEPGLQEMNSVHRGDIQWFSVQELVDQGYNIDLTYEPSFQPSYFQEHPSESKNEVYKRHGITMRNIVQTTKGNVLIVAHAGSLDACTRVLLKNDTEQPTKPEVADMKKLDDVSYCGVTTIVEEKPNFWTKVEQKGVKIKHLGNRPR